MSIDYNIQLFINLDIVKDFVDVIKAHNQLLLRKVLLSNLSEPD